MSTHQYPCVPTSTREYPSVPPVRTGQARRQYLGGADVVCCDGCVQRTARSNVVDVHVGPLCNRTPLAGTAALNAAHGRHTACALLHAACNMQHQSCHVKHVACTVHHATCNLRHATCNMKYTACNAHHATNEHTKRATCLQKQEFDHIVVAERACDHQRRRAHPGQQRANKSYASRSVQHSRCNPSRPPGIRGSCPCTSKGSMAPVGVLRVLYPEWAPTATYVCTCARVR